MKKLILLFVGSAFSCSLLIAQTTITLLDADLNESSPLVCGDYDLTDDTTGSYPSNYSEEIVICPSGAPKLSFLCDAGNGYWDVHESDTLYIYDGTSSSDALLVAANNSSNPLGVNVSSSWNNTSGCLTFKFVTDDALELSGWQGKIACDFPVQPMDLSIEAHVFTGESYAANTSGDNLNPADTSVNICLGDSIMFVADLTFLYEPGGNMGASNGMGYTQTNNVTVKWFFSDGTQQLGDTVFYTPPSMAGYFVELRVIDSMTQARSAYAKMRVGTTPNFAAAVPIDKFYCPFIPTYLLGGSTNASHTVYGAESVIGEFEAGGAFGDITFIPDGQGAPYQSIIPINQFLNGDTISDGGQVESICLSMEHSYLGDLEVWVQCPNGQTATIFDTYPGGSIPGGNSGGNTYLGNDNDVPNGGLADCWDYCFSETSTTPSWGVNIPTMANPLGNQAVVPGDYQPQGNFDNLIGCPLNGEWKVYVKDNLPADDGFVCSWSLNIVDSLNPFFETYNVDLDSAYWTADPTISGYNDSSVIVIPDSYGTFSYTLNVVNSFGCTVDTTVSISIVPLNPFPSLDLEGSGLSCDGQLIVFNPTLNSSNGRWWSVGDYALNFSSITGTSTEISANTDGEYTIFYEDSVCLDTLSQQVEFSHTPSISLSGSDEYICQNTSYVLQTTLQYTSTVVWNAIEGTLPDNLISSGGAFDESGLFIAAVGNNCGTDTAHFKLTVEACPVPNVFTPNNDGINDVFYLRAADFFDDVNVQVFNRWGKEILNTQGYKNDWIGTNKNGKPLNPGTYFYIVIYNEGKTVEKGFFEIFE